MPESNSSVGQFKVRRFATVQEQRAHNRQSAVCTSFVTFLSLCAIVGIITRANVSSSPCGLKLTRELVCLIVIFLVAALAQVLSLLITSAFYWRVFMTWFGRVLSFTLFIWLSSGAFALREDT